MVSPCLFIQWKDCSIENPEHFFFITVCVRLFFIRRVAVLGEETQMKVSHWTMFYA